MVLTQLFGTAWHIECNSLAVPQQYWFQAGTALGNFGRLQQHVLHVTMALSCRKDCAAAARVCPALAGHLNGLSNLQCLRLHTRVEGCDGTHVDALGLGDVEECVLVFDDIGAGCCKARGGGDTADVLNRMA